jgi:hypothetical protein
MEPKIAKESVVARLFGFGRKSPPPEPVPEQGPPETGFARTGASGKVSSDGAARGSNGDAEGRDEDGAAATDQVIRVRPRRAKDEAVHAISDSFRELTSLLGSVSDRLDRQDSRSGDLAEQLSELPEYLRTLPQLQQEQNDTLRQLGEQVGGVGHQIARSGEIARDVGEMQTQALRDLSGALLRIPEASEEQSRAVLSLGERVAEGNEAMHGVADAVVRSTDELRERSQAQEEAIRQVASAHQQTAKAIYAGQQKQLQVFHSATQKTLQQVQSQAEEQRRQAEEQRRQMEGVLSASVQNMRRMFVLAVVLLGATAATVAAVLLLR